MERAQIPVLHVLGMIAEAGEVVSAEDVADAEPGLVGHGKHDSAARHAAELCGGGSGIGKVLEDFEAGDDVEAARGEGQSVDGGEHLGGGFGVAIEQDGAGGFGEWDAAQHFAFAAAGVEKGVGGEVGESGGDAGEEAVEDETDDRVGGIVLLLAEH